MSRSRALFAAALAVGAGCGVPLDASLGQATVNTCSTNSDCGADATCTQGKCVATRYDLANLLLEVRPHAGATFGAGTSYLIDPGAAGVSLVSDGGGTPFPPGFAVKLGYPFAIKGGKVLLDPSTVPGKGCNFPDGSVPARLTFYRVPRFAGLPFDPVQVTTQAQPDGTYSFDIALVSDQSDRYDVYIEPQPVAGCEMSIPPYFLANQRIDTTIAVRYLPPIGALSGTLNGLTDTTSWQIDVVEPSRGLPISVGSHLVFATGALGVTVTAQIFSIDPANSPILRLTPVDPTQPDPKPVDPSRPTVYWALKGAVLGGTKTNPEVSFTVEDLVVTPISVQGQILGPDGITGIPSRLTLQSQTLKGANAGNAAFSMNDVLTEPTGAFSVGLPPGDYSVRIFPTADNALSITDGQITWPANTMGLSCVCGVTFELDRKATLAGTATTHSGQPLTAATVGIAPSQTLARTYLADTHSLGPLPSRVATTTTDGSGGFSLLADLGTCDLSVQTDPATNLPWLVLPGVSPDPSGTPAALVLTSPVFLRGTVRDPQDKPVTNAQIDAWYPVRDPTNPAVLTGTVVKIATASTDAGGAYTLVLPSSISSRGLK